MNSFILYLFEASLVLIVLYGAYRFLLCKETFFSFNRFFLISILALSLLLPLVSFEFINAGESFINQQGTELGLARNSYHTTFENWSEWSTISTEDNASWWQQFTSQDWGFWRIIMVLAIVIYTIGLTYRVFKLSLGYVKIYQMKKKLVATDLDGLNVMEVAPNMAPFSFLNTVFIPANIEDETEYAQILAHEKTHIQQRHSIDLIFVQLIAAFLWFNPVVWLLIKSLKQTHEYIADKNMLQQGFSLVEYQSLLLRQLISNNSYGLVHNFNLSFIKKRIAMMSIKESGWTGRSKAVLAIGIILVVGAITVKSNPLPATSATEMGTSGTKAAEITFYLDNVSLKRGLLYTRLDRYDGEFKFAFDNGQKDRVHLGLDLLRNGKIVGHAGYKFQEGVPVDISALLSKAQKDDYLVIDIIDGPAKAAKLYNFALFRDSEGWKKNKGSHVPAPQVTLSVNGSSVSPEKGLLLDNMKDNNFSAQMKYEISEFVDFEILSRQAGDVRVSLLRGGIIVRAVVDNKVKREATFDISVLLKIARKGDEIMIQFGKADGLRFGSKFSVE